MRHSGGRDATRFGARNKASGGALHPPTIPSGDHLHTKVQGPVPLKIWMVQPLKASVDGRLIRHPSELHACLLGSAATLAMVARTTSGSEVIPRVATAAVPRHLVIQRE